MRIAVLTGLFACTLILSLSTATASAQTAESATQTEVTQENNQLRQSVVDILSAGGEQTILKVLTSEEVVAQNEQENPPTPVEIKHVVTENETLSDIAKKYTTEWKRIYDKNQSIADPDLLTVGMELVIPGAEEVLTPRELPVPVQAPVEPAPVVKTAKKTPVSAPAPVVRPQVSSAGNGYVAGYCTWYVKNKRPDLPNNLGNAISWVSRAAAQGFATGSTPKVGAVGQHGNHVVYVESVNDDGTVTISEMNHKGLYVQTTRTLPASYFSYIY